MGYCSLVLDVSPNATAYDEDYPTRSTELLNHQLHEMIVDMDDATGSWYLTDEAFTPSEFNVFEDWVRDAVKVVFDYAEQAIDTYRASGTPTLSEPTANELQNTSYAFIPSFAHGYARVTQEVYKFMYFIYYMWKTEEDPLLLKEKLQELLIAWPLMDTTIDLQTESGQTIRMYPSWKNVDLDL